MGGESLKTEGSEEEDSEEEDPEDGNSEQACSEDINSWHETPRMNMEKLSLKRMSDASSIN